jgi:hypothetical protein
MAAIWHKGLQGVNPDIRFADLYDGWLAFKEKDPESFAWHVNRYLRAPNSISAPRAVAGRRSPLSGGSGRQGLALNPAQPRQN